MLYSIGKGQQAVQGIPIGRLNDLESRLSALENNSSTTTNMNATSETIYGSSNIYSATHLPVFITINGVMYFSGDGYTLESNVFDTPTGDVNGVNRTFQVTNTPDMIFVNGIVYYEDSGYTRNGLEITFDSAPMIGSIIKYFLYYKLTLAITPTANSLVVSYYSTNMTVETPSGIINSINVTFTVANTPKFIVLNGTSYFENDGYTRSGLTLTLLVIPPTGSVLRSIY